MTTLRIPVARRLLVSVLPRPDLSGFAIDRRRALQLALGVIWLLDAALQYQPYMFTKGFVSQVIGNSASGNPAVIAGPITWSAGLMARHIVVCNTVFATIQLLIAIGLFRRPAAKAALAASIPWAVGVWWIGEGLGGTLTGAASPFMGGPGAAVLYVFLALLAWPTGPDRADTAPRTASVATSGRLGRTLPLIGWGALWAGLAGFALRPASRSPGALSAMVSGMKAGEPGWIAAMDRFIAGVFAHHGTAASITVAAACALVATAIVSGPLTRFAVITAAILGAVFWITEDFGAIFTGQGTDPNSGLLLIVLAAAFWPLTASRPDQPVGDSTPACRADSRRARAPRNP